MRQLGDKTISYAESRKKNRLIVLLSYCLIVFSSFPVAAQPVSPPKAQWRVEIVQSKAPGELEALISAKIPDGWHMYDLGPYEIPSMATVFDFSASSGIELVGQVRQRDTAARKMDEIFGFEVGYFDGEAGFSRRFKVREGVNPVLRGEVEYQLCTDSECVRDVWEFEVEIKSEVLGAVGERSGETAGNNLERDPSPRSARFGMTKAGGENSLWALILEAILWGFAALLTPCVFPMVPMTISFFMKDHPGSTSHPSTGGELPKTRNGIGKFRALLFGGAIVALYTVPIAVVIAVTYFAGGQVVTADIFNWLATHWVPNVLFFVVFMAFAASLFGAFEMRMPSWLVNKSDRGVEKGGVAGVFFLALTLVLVSFSCTGPIVGTVLIKSVQGEIWTPILTMLAFSVAFALPFTLLAFFPRLIEKLPKNGGWLNSVKVVLGFVEIALGLKFLSVADQVYHWNILPREVYLAIWIVVFALLGVYLLGKIRFKYDSPTEHIGVGRLFGAIAVFAFVVYLLPGMWGARLEAISGYLPPLHDDHYSVATDPSPRSAHFGMTNEGSAEEVKYGDKLELPHGLNGFFDLDEGLEYAREVGLPVFLDFTGHACVNCREMEQRVWSDPEVLEILSTKFVIIALYSDDRMALPEADRLTTPDGKTLRTLGRKNSYIMSSRYGVSAQPTYLILDGDGRAVNESYGYSLDVEEFKEWLNLP